MTSRLVFGLVAVVLSSAAPALAATETIVIIRHGEKPPDGLGQLSCKGLNRALALPAVLLAKFGRPSAVFVPNPAQRKEDGGMAYDYVRPLATVEPSAIRFGLPVDTQFGFRDIDGLRATLEQPAYRDATVIIAWEHHLLEEMTRQLVAAHGGDAKAVPQWHGDDYDGIYVIRITRTENASAVTFSKDSERLDSVATACPS